MLNEKQAAERLGMSIRTLQMWRLRRQGPPFSKLGGAVRYNPSDLDAFIQRGRIDPVAGQQASAAEVGR